ITITPPGVTTPATTYVYPSVGADGTLYVGLVGGFDTTNKNRVGHVYVTRSLDDGVTFGPFVEAATPGENPNGFLPNPNFRDGIIESFPASQTYPGHVYLTYEDWDAASGQFDVKFRQSTDGGLTWSPGQTGNDAPKRPTTDKSHTPPTLPQHRGDANPCIDVSLQAYKDAGTAAGAVPVGGNVRVSQFTWDPDQSQQKGDGITQYACAGHNDPCPTGRGFIGDYFGLAISNGNVYTYAVSTHYPSPTVTSD